MRTSTQARCLNCMRGDGMKKTPSVIDSIEHHCKLKFGVIFHYIALSRHTPGIRHGFIYLIYLSQPLELAGLIKH